jgi:hypothetical protein
MDTSQIAITRLSSDKQGSGGKEVDRFSHGSREVVELKVAHTLSACTRCRKVRHFPC